MKKTRIAAPAIAAALAAVILLAPSQPTFAENYTVTEISADKGYFPKLNDWGDAIWWKPTSATYESYDLLCYGCSPSGGVTKLISYNGLAPYTAPPPYGIANNGDAAWQIIFPGEADRDLFTYNRASGTITRITSNDYDDLFYRINDNGDVLFVSRVPSAPGSPEHYELNVHFSGGSTKKLAAFDPDYLEPEQVNWNGDAVLRKKLTYRLYLYLADKGAYQALTAKDASLSGWVEMNEKGDIVWVETRGRYGSSYTSAGVSLYERATGSIRQLSDIPYPALEYNPLVSENGNVVWTGTWPDYDIYYYDAAQNKVTRLTKAPYPYYGYWDKDINANGDACWVDWSPPNDQRKVYVYNARAGTISMVDGIHVEQDWPQINNYRDVVFEAGSWQARVVVLARPELGEVEREIVSLTQTVDTLAASGGVDPSVASDLNQLLTSAQEQLWLDQPDKAIQYLDKFKDKVDKERDKGNITSDAANTLTTEAKRLIGALSGR